MKNANVKGADRYYHCTAMQEATQLGPGGELAAHVANWGREAGDTVNYQVRRLWGIVEDLDAASVLGSFASHKAEDLLG